MITQIVIVFFTLLYFSIANYYPINSVDLNYTMNYPSFIEQRSKYRDQNIQYYPTVMILDRTLYIGTMDQVFAVDLDASQEENIVSTKKLIWEPTDEDIEQCKILGKKETECRNFIKVLIKRNNDTIFVCGTNAFKPICRNYKIENLEPLGNIDGRGKCPLKQDESNIALFSDGSLYSATAVGIRGLDQLIYRSLGDQPHLRTAIYNSKWLKEPFFVHGFDYGNYVYFFFREVSVEYEHMEKVIISRVARVCKNDIGGNPTFPENEWTSFLKATLTCAIPGGSSYHLQAVSDVTPVYGRNVIFAIYSTNPTSVYSSALCAFDIEDIDKAFTGSFKEKTTPTSFWTPVPERNVPIPRPGSCAGSGSLENYKTSKDIPSDTIDFIRKHPLMDGSVQPISSGPLYLIPHARTIMVQIAVDNNAGPNGDHTVLFVGTNRGDVFKFLLIKDDNGFVKDIIFLEDMYIFQHKRCPDTQTKVVGLKLDKLEAVIYVVFGGCIIRVPIGSCERHRPCKNACLGSRDPYCGWVNEKCVYLPPGTTDNYEQDLNSDKSTWFCKG